MFLNEVRNHAFGDWLAGVPLSYTTQLTNAAQLQLQKSFLRNHPARLTIPSEAIGGGQRVFIYEGPNSYRVTLTAAAAVGDWALWPSPEIAGQEHDVTHIGPFFVIPGTNDRIQFDIGGLPLVAEIADGWYDADTLGTAVDVAMTAAGLATVTTFDGVGRLFTMTHAGVLNIDWLGSSAAVMMGYTANDTGGLAYQSDVPAPANMKYRAYEGKQYQFSVVARGSVPGNLLRVRVIGLGIEYEVGTYLNASGVWQAAAAQRTFQLSSQWRAFGVHFEAPPGVRYFLWQVSNGTAGAQVIDLGRFWWQNPTWQMGGEEVRA